MCNGMLIYSAALFNNVVLRTYVPFKTRETKVNLTDKYRRTFEIYFCGYVEILKRFETSKWVESSRYITVVEIECRNQLMFDKPFSYSLIVCSVIKYFI